ncbi:unnamed protein product [Victoria cruziana]
MRFHYIKDGWEGSATDSRVLYRKYYLDDGCYPNIRGLLTLYRGYHYHISEFSTSGARRVSHPEELFNHRHSSLRTMIEHAFDMLKGRFLILKVQVSYPYKK